MNGMEDLKQLAMWILVIVTVLIVIIQITGILKGKDYLSIWAKKIF